MNIGVHIYLFESVFLLFFRYIPRNRVAGSYGGSAFRFWDISILFSIVAVPVYISTCRIRGFPFLRILSLICYLCSLLIAILTGVRRYLFLGLNLISLMISDIEHFSCAFCSSAFPLRKYVYSALSPIFKLGSLDFVCCWVVWVVYMCWILILYQLYSFKISYPIQWIFVLLMISFAVQKLLSLIRSYLLLLLFPLL